MNRFGGSPVSATAVAAGAAAGVAVAAGGDAADADVCDADAGDDEADAPAVVVLPQPRLKSAREQSRVTGVASRNLGCMGSSFQGGRDLAGPEPRDLP